MDRQRQRAAGWRATNSRSMLPAAPGRPSTVTGTLERFTTTMKDEIVRWGEVVKFSGAKVD